VKGDGKMMSIAAASILAKTHRDEFMARIHEEFPQYAWNINKGYPTKAHRAAISQYGPSPYHRKSFRLLDTQLSLFENE
jgi:ribonuclease HII